MTRQPLPSAAPLRTRAYYGNTCPCGERNCRMDTETLQLFRRVSFGNLAQVHVLDTRQYRSAGAPANCDITTRIDGYCPSALDPTRTIQGEKQANWLVDGLGRSRASWNILANQLRFAPSDGNAEPDIRTLEASNGTDIRSTVKGCWIFWPRGVSSTRS